MMGREPAIEGAVWPPVVTGDAAQLTALLAQMDTTQWLPPAEIEAGQGRQLAALIAHHVAGSPHFAARLRAAGLDTVEAATPAGFQRIAIMDQAGFTAAKGLFSAVPPEHDPVREAATPFPIRRTGVNWIDWLAMAMRDHVWHRRDLGGRLAVIRPEIAEVGTHEGWGPPASLLGSTGPALTIPVALEPSRQLALLRDFAPTSLLTTLGNLGRLLDAMEVEGALLGLTDIRVTGGIAGATLRARCRRVADVTIIGSHSLPEIGYVALPCPDGRGYHAMAETVLVEIVDRAGKVCGPGQPGLLVVTDLRNFATPLIRYATGDRATPGGPCPCGRGLPTIARIVPRRD